MCCSNTGYSRDEIDGICPDCGEPTVDGCAYDACEYSSIECKTCGYAPCDESC